jgi:hypothetical protein
MTKYQIEEEISLHLNRASKRERKRVEENIEYILAMKDGDIEAALRLALEILYGSANNMAEHHRQMKKKKKLDQILKFV